MRTAAAITTAAIVAVTLTGCFTAKTFEKLPNAISGPGTYTAGENLLPGYYEPDSPTDGCEVIVTKADGAHRMTGLPKSIIVAKEGDTVTVSDACGTYTWTQAD